MFSFELCPNDLYLLSPTHSRWSFFCPSVSKVTASVEEYGGMLISWLQSGISNIMSSYRGDLQRPKTPFKSWCRLCSLVQGDQAALCTLVEAPKSTKYSVVLSSVEWQVLNATYPVPPSTRQQAPIGTEHKVPISKGLLLCGMTGTNAVHHPPACLLPRVE